MGKHSFLFLLKRLTTTRSCLGLLLVISSVGLCDPIRLPDTFPIAMTFRAFDEIQLGRQDFDKAIKAQTNYGWLHAPGPANKAAAIRKQLPDKIITIQAAYGGISENEFSAVWPGHLLYKTGTRLTKNISPNDDTLAVQNTSVLAKNNQAVQQTNKNFPFALTLYGLDDKNKPDWSRAEHILLLGVKNGAIIVKRGQWGTRPLAFKAGKTVIAAHMMFWTKQWQLNFSVHSPRGGLGNLTAQEWYAKRIATRIDEAKADGVEFDVGRWTWGTPALNPMDVNNDGLADYGYIDGVNSFGLGGQLFFQALRQQLGPDKIIQVDSNDAMYGIRGWKYLNGVQLESFPGANDFDNFSQNFSHLRLWVENAEATPRVSYPFTKTPTTVFANTLLPNGKKTDFHFRVGFAAACLTGMPHPFASLDSVDFDPANAKSNHQASKEIFGTFNWDEYHGGDLNNWHWLGKPITVATQDFSNLDRTDVLEKINWRWAIDKGFTANLEQSANSFSADVRHIPNGLLPKVMWSAVRLEPKNTHVRLIPGNAYTVQFDARGEDTWRYLGQTFERVPRMLTLHGALKSKSDRPLSVLVDSQWRTYKIGFIADSSRTPTPVFGVSEQTGLTEIRNIILFAGSAERWSREFEKGLVLLNMTDTTWKVPLKKGQYRYLKGAQDPVINNGRMIEDQISVPARDAVFLAKR